MCRREPHENLREKTTGKGAKVKMNSARWTNRREAGWLREEENGGVEA